VSNALPLLLENIVAACTDKAIWVAYSGGVDSHVLLHLLATNKQLPKARLHAIHIDHGLHAESVRWAEHCAEVATSLGVDFHCHRVAVSGIADTGLEAAARQARYQAIAEELSENDIVLTAQHQEDQAESLLLQLLRGAGPKGLSAMAGSSSLGQGQLMRPFLGVNQSAIKAYAACHQLHWLDDPSNDDQQFNRNYIRHAVWPVIVQRWPSAASTLSRSAEHCAESESLLSELAELDLAHLAVADGVNYLPVSGLLTLSRARCRNLLRYFIAHHQFVLPSTVILQKIIEDVCLAAEDSAPIIRWTGVEVRRYQGQLYFLSPLSEHDVARSISLHGPDKITLSEQCCVTWLPADKLGVSQDMFDAGLRLGFRQGGEKIQLQGHQQHKRLKQLYQEWAIPPWERDRIPLLFHNDELIAVVGYGLSEQCVLAPGEQGYLPTIKRQGKCKSD